MLDNNNNIELPVLVPPKINNSKFQFNQMPENQFCLSGASSVNIFIINYYYNMRDKLLLTFGVKFQHEFIISHVKLQCCYGNFLQGQNSIQVGKC